MIEEKQVVEKLILLTQTVSKHQIEVDLGIPKNNLSGFIAGNRTLSKKWWDKILSYEPATKSRVELLQMEVDALKKENGELRQELSVLKANKDAKPKPDTKLPKQEEKPVNELKTTDKDEIQRKIDTLTVAASNCGTTYFGKVAKEDYLRRIKELKKGLL